MIKNYSTGGRYANLDNASPSPNIIITGPVPSNPPQYQVSENNSQYALNNNNRQFQAMSNNQQNSYNIDSNDQQAAQEKNEGKRTGARTGFLEFGLPIILRYTLENSLGLVWASVISSIPIVLSMLYSIFITKMFNPFSIVMILSIYIDLGFRLAFSDKRLQLLTGTVIGGIVALGFFVTIPFDNAFTYYLAKPMATGGDKQKCAEFDTKWKFPATKMISTRISIGLGVGFLLSAGINAALVLTLPVNVINIVSIAFSILSALILTVWAKWYKDRKAKEYVQIAQVRNVAK